MGKTKGNRIVRMVYRSSRTRHHCSERLYLALEEISIVTIGELVDAWEHDKARIMRQKNIGRVSGAEIESLARRMFRQVPKSRPKRDPIEIIVRIVVDVRQD